MNIWLIGLPIPVALASVALIGYMWGRRIRHLRELEAHPALDQIRDANAIVQEMEEVARDIRRHLANHHASVLHFKERLLNISLDDSEALSVEAELVLTPTVELSDHLAQAYDDLRGYTSKLMKLTDNHTDPMTGLGNRRILDESISQLFALKERYSTDFSMIVMDIDHFHKFNNERGYVQGNALLREVGQVLATVARSTDVVIRSGGEEFIVLIPETDLEGACEFAERMRTSVEEETDVTISCGVTTALDGDTHRMLTGRADTALFTAKKTGRNRCCRHTGQMVEPVLVDDEFVVRLHQNS